MIKIRSILLFITLFFVLNGCLYTCNYMPEGNGGGGGGGNGGGGTLPNTDPCDPNNKATLLRFIDVSQASSGRMQISFMMKLPCDSGKGGQTFSLAFYNKDKLTQPSDLTQLNFSQYLQDNDMTAPKSSCKASLNTEAIEVLKNIPGLYELSQGAALSLWVGKNSTSTLQPAYIKTSLHSPSPTGKAIGWLGLGNCAGDGVDFSPFNVASDTNITAIFKDNLPVTPNKEEVDSLYGLYSQQLVTIGAPLFTYGTYINNKGQGIPSTNINNDTKGTLSRALKASNSTIDGSIFEFEVDIKPGNYYLVLSEVPNPTGATSGDFTLSNIKVYNRFMTDQILDYATQCPKSVTCGSVISIN